MYLKSPAYGRGFLLCVWNDADKLCFFECAIEARSLSLCEFDDAVHYCEQGIILALFYIFARMNPGTTLAYDYATVSDALSISYLDAKVLWIGISSQPGGATRFLM